MIHHLRHRGTRSRVSSGSRADIRCAYGAKSVPREMEQSAGRRPTTQTADPSSGSECGDVSTFRKAQRYSLTSPRRSSTLSPANLATPRMSLPTSGQTFQQAIEMHSLRPYANQDWPTHTLDKRANTLQHRAFAYFAYEVLSP